MSLGKPNISLSDVSAIITAEPPKFSQTFKGVLMLLVVVGIAAFAFALTGDPRRAWTLFQVNTIYWFVVSAASGGFSAVIKICNAKWARPLQRQFEAASGYFTFAVIPLLAIYLFHGYEHIFGWAHEEVPGKELWYNPNFLYVRDAFAMLLLLWVTRRAIDLGLQQDFIAIRSGLTGVDKGQLVRWQDKQYEKLVPSWGSDPRAAIRDAYSRRGMMSPVVVIVHCLAFSLIAWDQIMSVDPHWYSTLFGPWLFMSGIYVAMAWGGLSIPLLRSAHPLYKQKIIRPTLHDLGKLLFGFGIFWTYLFWAHYLTIWYGNLPEETEWVITRLRVEPWHSMAWFTLWCLFLFPFTFGLSKDAKQVPPLLFLVSGIIATGIWMQMYIQIVAQQFPTTIPLGFLDLGVTAGFFGVFVLLALRSLERVPLIPFGDMYR